MKRKKLAFFSIITAGILILVSYTGYRYALYIPIIPYYPVCPVNANNDGSTGFTKVKGIWNKEFEDNLHTLYFHNRRHPYHFSAHDLYNHAMRIEETNWQRIYRDLNWELTKNTVYAVLLNDTPDDNRISLDTITCDQIQSIIIE